MTLCDANLWEAKWVRIASGGALLLVLIGAAKLANLT
jgi:hypothetical protein